MSSWHSEDRQYFANVDRLSTEVDDEQTLLWNLVVLRKKKSLPSVLK